MNKRVNSLKFVRILPLLFLFLSCKTATYTHIDEVIPAKNKFPEQMMIVKLMDRSIVKTGNSPSGSTAIITASDEAKNAMINDVKNGIPAPNVKLEKAKRDGKDSGPADPIRTSLISEYSGNSDGLFCLEEFDFTEQRTYKDIKKEQLDPAGRKYIIEAVAGTRLIYLRTYWRLYDGKTGKVVMTVPQYTENTFETEGLTRQGVNAQMDTSQIVTASTLSRQLSRSLIKDINPQPIKSYWDYYIKGNDVIVRSANMISKGDFRNSVELLSQNVKEIKEEKLKMRANYNLVISYYFNKQKEKALQLAAHEYNRTGKSMFKELYDKIYSR